MKKTYTTDYLFWLEQDIDTLRRWQKQGDNSHIESAEKRIKYWCTKIIETDSFVNTSVVEVKE